MVPLNGAAQNRMRAKSRLMALRTSSPHKTPEGGREGGMP